MSLDEEIRRETREGRCSRMAERLAATTAPSEDEVLLAQEIVESLHGVDRRLVQSLKPGQTLYHVHFRNADGSPLRARVNGKLKVWKRRPWKFSLPLKHGMYDYLYLHEGDAVVWRTKEEWAQ